MKEKDGEKEKSMEKLDKKLKKYLNSASSSKVWIDLVPIMKDILSLLSRNKKDYDFNEISLLNKQMLAKRLAQGLNPECPSGLHEVTIDVYEVFLKNIMEYHDNKLRDNLSLYACGLFPFFPNATSQNKNRFLEKIFYPIFFNLNKEEFKLCLPGLLSSLIPGLDDNTEQTTKLIYQTFDDIISKNNGEFERDFFGIYWMLLLRCQHLRSSGIKYLLEKSITYQDYIKLDEEKRKEKIEKQYPNLNVTVINALCEIIKDNDIPTVRNGMDFIITRLPLTKDNNLINDDAKINLLISGLQLCIKNDFSTMRRLKGWILGLNAPDDDVTYKGEDMDYKMNLLIKAFKIIFTSDKNLIVQNLINNILIVQRLFETDEEFIKFILKDIAYIIVKCMVDFWEQKLDCSENLIIDNQNDNSNAIMQFKNLFKKNDICFECLWESLADSIKELPQEIYTNILYKKINELLLPLKFTLIFIDNESNEERIKYFIPLISNLLNIINIFPIQRKDFKYLKQIVLITLAFIKTLQEPQFHDNNLINNENKDNKLKRSGTKRNSIFICINNEDDKEFEYINVYKISDEATANHILKDNNNRAIMDNLNKSIKLFQDYYIKMLMEYSNIYDELTKYEIFLFKALAELNIRLQEYSMNERYIPLWVKHLERLIFNENPNISNEAANILLDLNLSSSLKNNIYEIIKQDFSSEKMDYDIVEQFHNEKYIQKMNIQSNCFQLALAKYYFLLNKQSNSEVIMELLFKMYLFDKKTFIELINNTFNIEKDLIDNIKLFSNFWKLAKDYHQEITFFQKGECIFKMLDLLNDKNPVLRHLSKSWLNQRNQDYKKIIDPIMPILIDNLNMLQNIGKNNQLLNELTSKILDPFIKLKSIFLNSPLISFLPQFRDLKCDNYLQSLMGITLRYINIKDSNISDEKIKKDILSVKAASCEFLEFFLGVIEDKKFFDQNSKLINDDILKILTICLDQKDEVMPTQLLDILKVLYFKFNPETNDDKKKLLDTFKNKKLITILTKEMLNDNLYIRDHFISFTKKCVEKFISVISIDDKDQLKDFYDLCNELIKPLSNSLCNGFKIDDTEEKENTENFSHYDPKSNKIIYKNYCEEYKDYKNYDKNRALSILKGINDIISYCFKKEILEKRNKLDSKENVSFLFIPLPFKKKLKTRLLFSGDWREYKKELVNNMKSNNPFISFLNDISTIIIDYADEKSNNEISNMSTKLYYNQISDLLNNFLTIWINQSDKYEICDYCLNAKGILASTKVDPWNILDETQIANIKDNIMSDPIKHDIVIISMNLFHTDSIKFFENLISLWVSDEINKNQGEDRINDKQYKLSIIELLISMEIPLDVIIFCIGCIMQKQVYSKKDIYKKKDKYFETPFKISIYEAKILHFIYSYILLNPKKYNKVKDEIEIIEIWREIINIVSIIMNNTKIIYTFCWMYELIQLASEKISMKDFDNKEIKYGVESIFYNITSKLMDAVFSEKYDSKYQDESKLVFPILPHVYTNLVKIIFDKDNLYQKNIEVTQMSNKGNKSDSIDKNSKKNLTLFFSKTEVEVEPYFSKRPKSLSGPIKSTENFIDEISNEIHEFYRFYKLKIEKNEKMKNNILNDIYRSLSFITLKENLSSLIKNIFNDNISTGKKYFTDIIIKILNMINNKDENDFMVAFANEFLVSLMEDIPKSIVLCGKSQLMDFIKIPNFFNRNLNELHGWKIIISKMAENYPEILTDLINDMSDNIIFIKKKDKNKMDTLRRISFVIYSCNKDQFIKDFGLIREKAKELLSDDIENTLLEREIFLIMRMFFLRFSHDCVMQMIRDLWPIIFIKLVRNISKNDNLLVNESFKFIELLSLVNIEEFSLYQWIFMLDTFDMNDLDTNNKESLLNKILSNKDILFNPLSLEIIGKGNISVNENILRGQQKGKSELYIQGDSGNFTSKIKQFCYSIGDMNSYKVEANYEQIEKMIENDFQQQKLTTIKTLIT